MQNMKKVVCFVLVLAVLAYVTADDATTAATTAAATTPAAPTPAAAGASSTAAPAAHPVQDMMVKGLDSMNKWQKQMADTGKQWGEKAIGVFPF